MGSPSSWKAAVSELQIRMYKQRGKALSALAGNRGLEKNQAPDPYPIILHSHPWAAIRHEGGLRAASTRNTGTARFRTPLFSTETSSFC